MCAMPVSENASDFVTARCASPLQSAWHGGGSEAAVVCTVSIVVVSAVAGVVEIAGVSEAMGSAFATIAAGCVSSLLLLLGELDLLGLRVLDMLLSEC